MSGKSKLAGGSPFTLTTDQCTDWFFKVLYNMKQTFATIFDRPIFLINLIRGEESLITDVVAWMTAVNLREVIPCLM